jgi:glucose/arabinose dehydrogenase
MNHLLRLTVIASLWIAFVTTAFSQNKPVESDYYKLESLPIPAEAFLEAGGLEVMPDGRLAVSSRRGEIWMFDSPLAKDVESIDANLYARGLHEVLGLASRSGWLYCIQRGELTRMKDTNDDGRADIFETVNDEWEINGDYHEYAFSSKFDKNGHLWSVFCLTGSFSSNVKFRGWCLRLTEDGKAIPTCSGIRSPGGIGFNIAGDVFYTDNQGPWNGTCALKWLQPGSFQGHPAGNRWYEFAPNMKQPTSPKSGSRFHVEADKIPEYVPAAILFPYNKMGKSASGVESDISSGKFGPFAGQMFVGDQGHSTIMRCYLEKVNDRYQGACFMFRQGIGSGTLPLLMHKDGAMFVGGTNRGWGSRGVKPYSLERLTWTGKVPFEVHEMRAKPDGFELTFTKPVNAKTAADLASYKMTTYTYIFQSSYGSPEVDHTTPKITRAIVASDRKSVRLVVDGLQRGHVHELHMPGVRSDGGYELLHNVGYYTLNYIPKEPSIAKAGEVYDLPIRPFTLQAPGAELKGVVHYRPVGNPKYLKIDVLRGKEGNLYAEIPAAGTAVPFEYYLEFTEAGRSPVTRPAAGAQSPIQVQVDAQPPSKVTGLESGEVSDTSLDIIWNAASDDRGVTGYRLFRGEVADFDCNDTTSQGDVQQLVLQWTDAAPPAGTTAWYAVRAIDVVGRLGPPQYISVDVPKNMPPGNKLKLTAVSTGAKAFLRWTGELDADVVTVQILRGEGEKGELDVVKQIADRTIQRFIDEGLKTDGTYRYAIRLIDRGKLASEMSEPQVVRAGLFLKRINCGGDEFIGADGIPWEADKGRVTGSSVWTQKKKIEAAEDIEPIYQTERWAYTTLRYRMAVEPGTYQVTLHFAEINPRFAQAGKRVFDVQVNDKKVHPDVDIAAQVGGSKAYQLTSKVEVAGKELVIDLTKVKNGPAIKGIEVRAVP